MGQTLATKLAAALQPLNRPAGAAVAARGVANEQVVARDRRTEAAQAAWVNKGGEGLPAALAPVAEGSWGTSGPGRRQAAEPAAAWPRAHPSRAPPAWG